MTQEEALDALKLGYNIYLTGPAGSGKTFLLQKYINYLRKNGKGVGVTASTGIAATYMNGITIHSFSGLGIKDKVLKQDIEKILRKRWVKKRFENTGVIIIDEISMLSADQFDSLNLICQAFRENKLPFGGLQIVCSGDLFQLPPIERDGKPVKFIFESNVWQNMDIKVCYLEEQYRQKESDTLLKLLNHIRKSEIEGAKNVLAGVNFDKVFFNQNSVKLFTHNINVDVLNNKELGKIKSKQINYFMQSSGNKKVVEALKRGCLAPEKLSLRVGAKVMFVKNNFEEGYVNGTLGIVESFDEFDNLPIVKTANGRRIKASFVSWATEENEKIIAQIRQIPLRLAWAITVHKSQGMNLDSAEIDLSKSFVEGMGYVALSRLRSLDGLKLFGINDMAFMVNKAISEVDGKLKENSASFSNKMTAMAISEKIRKQKEFLDSLPTIDKIKNSNQRKEEISNLDMTKMFVKNQISIAQIARILDLKEETIINHIEKITEKDGTSGLEYLKPQRDRFNKIKVSFENFDDFKLSPVKEILGDDFSYKEIRLARIFLR